MLSRKKNKPRLAIALFVRSGGKNPKMPGLEDKYHWGLMITTKTSEPNHLLHAKEKMSIVDGAPQSTWTFESTANWTGLLVSLVQFGKILDRERLVEVLEEVEVKGGKVEGWNCVSWVREAVEACERDGRVLGRGAVFEWSVLRERAMEYLQLKKSEGRFEAEGKEGVPTWDLVEGREVVA